MKPLKLVSFFILTCFASVLSLDQTANELLQAKALCIRKSLDQMLIAVLLPDKCKEFYFNPT